MTRPISNTTGFSWKKYLINSHQKVSHNTRVETIAHALIEQMEQLKLNNRKISCLDIGCGDMKIAEIIGHFKPETSWKCIDLYSPPESSGEQEKWSKYRTFDGKTIPYRDNEFDFTFLVDVLHHAESPLALIKEALRVSDWIVIKDHFQYGFFSRFMLTAMDLYGNWAYNIKVTGKYFNQTGFAEYCAAADVEIVRLQAGIDLYGHLPLLKHILDPAWQFVAILKKK